MSVVVATTRVACNTATGNQNITTSKLGDLTPKAALFVVTYGVTDGTAADDAVLSFGACDDTEEWCINSGDEHGQDTSDTDHIYALSNCIYIRDPASKAANGAAQFSSFITNGVTINWTSAPSSAYLLTVTLFAGTDLSVDADSVSLGNTVDLTTNIENPGFEVDVVIAATCRLDAVHAEKSVGFVAWDGVSTITQRCIGGTSRSGRDTTEPYLMFRTDSGLCQITNSVLDWYGVFSDFDSLGFSVTTTNDGGNNQYCHYLALKFNGAVSHFVGTYTTPSGGGGGNDSEAGIGFPPQAVMLLPSLAEAASTLYSDGRAGTCGVAVFDDTDEYCTTATSENNQDVSDTQSLSDDQALNVPDHDGTLEYSAAFVSMDSSGFTLNYGTEPSTAKLMPMLAIEAEAAGETLSIAIVPSDPSYWKDGPIVVG